jgi:hypothetical protein
VPPLVALFFSLSAAEGVPFPLEVGTWWEFKESYTEHLGEIDSTSEDLTRFEVRGTGSRLVLRQTGGPDAATTPIEVGEDWLRFGVFTGEDALPLPLRAGSASGNLHRFTVEKEEVVKVPSGVYLALRCSLRTRDLVSLLWIAEGVGVVREVEGRPDAHPDLERVLVRWGESRRGDTF